KKATDVLYLDILTNQLVDYGAKVLMTRHHFVERLEYWANELHQTISQKKEELKIQYVSTIEPKTWQDLSEVRSAFEKTLKNVQQKERFRQVTLAGPHRDDLRFFINGKDVQTYGSQGQQRTTALSVKLAEIDLIKEETDEYPLLLLDDVMSELDDSRQLHLLEAIEGKVQTFLTTTTLEHLKEKMTLEPEIYYVHQGKIEGKKV